MLSAGKLAGKRVLITGGPTIEPVDSIRVLTNRSSGRTGIELAREAYRQGANVTLVHSKELNLRMIREIRVETAEEMIDACINELRKANGGKEKEYDALISAAAISDFSPELHDGKLPSGAELHLTLVPTRKPVSYTHLTLPTN